jgi:YfiH family protein
MFKLEQFMDKRVLTSSLMEGEDVVAFFTTRDLPLKSGEREDLVGEVDSNKKLICEGFNIPEENLFIPQQTHSDNVEIIDINKSFYSNCDALITDKEQVAIALNFADCVPIILYDSVKKVIAIAHAGWRGTASTIVKKTVEKMQEEFLTAPKDIIALIGPAIGKCCFEVQDDVAQKILQTVDPSGHALVYDNGYIDLKLVNKIQLLSSGVEKIDVCAYCTCCKTELFFSYRQEKNYTARHSAVMILK